MAKVKHEETLFEKERRLKSRKQDYKVAYKKGVYYNSWQYDNLIKYLKEKDVLVRVLNAGSLNDGTDFITITIEGFKAPEDGI